jgi:ribosome-binding factor A
MSIKDERMKEQIRELAAEFLNRESTRAALLTVTRVELSDDQKRARILLSVMPKDKEYGAVDFANRHRSEFSDYIKKHSKIHFLPQITFHADIGEENRQRIDELLEIE